MTKAALFTQVLIAGCAVLLTGFAVRAGFGVFQTPISEAVNRARSDVSPTIAVPNLARGSGRRIFGALAEKFGARRAIIVGAPGRWLGGLKSS